MKFSTMARINDLWAATFLWILQLRGTSGQFEADLTLQSVWGRLEVEARSIIQCFSDDHYEKIMFSRKLDTGQGRKLPRHSHQSMQRRPMSARILSMPDEDVDDVSRFGAFQCKIVNENVATEIITLKLPPSSLVELDALSPYNVVNLGDSLELQVNVSKKLQLPIRWRHNGEEKPAWDDQLKVMIENARPSDAGIYECFYDGRRNENAHALMRLIVRNCPADLYGANCDKKCPSCYNGGICNDQWGACVCPAGFTGLNCERACGGNRFGGNCDKLCSSPHKNSKTDELCSHSLFCKPDPYGCSCAPGFKGSSCMEHCEPGWYGADCKQRCHCASGISSCNRITGACEGGCAAGWKGNSCQIEGSTVCSPGRFGENCESICHCEGGHHNCDEQGFCHAGCQAGWNGFKCQTGSAACRPGRFGDDCESICHCEGGHRNCGQEGFCHAGCEAGWSGFTCQIACRPGRFGENCESICHCEGGHSNCDDEGLCQDGCEAGWVGITCQTECTKGRFGPNCASTCHCHDNSTTPCDKRTGVCDGDCEAGYMGDDCQTRQFEADFTLQSAWDRLQVGFRTIIQCYSDDHYKKIKLSRKLDTGKGPRLPKHSQQFIQRAPAYTRILFMPDEDNLSRFGAFQCKIVNQNVATEIITLKLAPSSLVELDASSPYNVANLGDSVELQVNVSKKLQLPIRWRHNGEEKPAWDDQLKVKIENARPSDAGIYECFYDGRRNESVHALMRLIVRNCPVDLYGADCDKKCPSCYNGGICHDQWGVCVCPAGFTGLNCERACGSNHFGANCDKFCSPPRNDNKTDEFCSRFLFCKPDPYGCSCAPGFKGSSCVEHCEPGWYGADCKQPCHCAHNTTICDMITGACEAGCAKGWEGNSCQIEVSAACRPGRFGDNCESICHCEGGHRNCDNEGFCHAGCEAGWAGFTCQTVCPYNRNGKNCTQECLCLKSGLCNSVDGSCSCQGRWKGLICNESEPQIVSASNEEVNTGQQVFISCTADAVPAPIMTITSSDQDELEILVRTLEQDRYQAVVEVNPREAGQFEFICTARNLHGLDMKKMILYVIDPPRLITAPWLLDKTNISLSIGWKDWELKKDIGGRAADRIEYMVVYRENGSTHWKNVDGWGTEVSSIVEGLTPNTLYEVAVKCRRLGKGGEGDVSPGLFVKTECGVPTADGLAHEFLPKDSISQTTVTLTWKPPYEGSLRCPLKGYYLSYHPVGNGTILQTMEMDANTTTVHLEDLSSSTVYVFRLYAVTDVERSKYSVVLALRTSELLICN